jgi:3-deoxy-manno-octulosonate cytidylyltransferase (CMP-KDO synthetase)
LSRAVTPLIAIPVRLAATRLPNKPLRHICGKPLVLHALECARNANVGRVIVACGDAEIADVVTNAGGQAVLTDPALPSGSDRVAAAAEIVDPKGYYDVVVNLQGDIPDIRPEELRAVLAPLLDPAVDIGTLASIMDPALRSDPGAVKLAIVFGAELRIGRVLYFSRATIPSGDGPLYHHFGVFAYRRAALKRFVKLPQGVLEARERLEQLRALEAGMRIDVALIDRELNEVNTPEDLARAEARLAAQQG